MRKDNYSQLSTFKLFIFIVLFLSSSSMSLLAQTLTVQTPNGGETWTYGQGEIVTWTGNNLGSQIALDFSSNGGASWSYYGNAPSGPNGGSCTVSVPNIPTENALIRVSDAANPSISDESNAPFTVFVAPITIFVPNGDSFIFDDISMYTNWELTVSGISLLNAELSTDNGATFTTIAQNLVAGLYYTYLPISVAEPSDSCILRLSNAANPAQFGLSQLFSILPQPVYTITYPSAGDFLNTQTSYMITFTVENPFVQYCSAEYSIDGGYTWVYFNGGYIQGNSGSFEWITPETGSDECLIRITDGFEPTITDTSGVFSVFTFPDAPICMVTVDSLNGYNTVVWEKPVTGMITDFLVYRETDESNVYEVIDTVSYESLSISIDPSSNPAIRPYRYKLGYIDTLSRIFPASDFHQTIHLTISQGVGDAWNLIWTAYLGFDYSTYRILRKSNEGLYEQIATVSASFNTYTDFNAPTGDVSYIVEVVSPGGCDPDPSRDSGYGSVYSNVASNSPVAVSDLPETDFSVFPIPAKDRINVTLDQVGSGPAYLTITDLSGRRLLATEVHASKENNPVIIATNNIPDGIYILQVSSAEKVSSQKIVIRR